MQGLPDLAEDAFGFVEIVVDWRSYDLETAVRFYAPLLTDVGLLKTSADDLMKSVDLKIFKELSTELKK